MIEFTESKIISLFLENFRKKKQPAFKISIFRPRRRRVKREKERERYKKHDNNVTVTTTRVALFLRKNLAVENSSIFIRDENLFVL